MIIRSQMPIATMQGFGDADADRIEIPTATIKWTAAAVTVVALAGAFIAFKAFSAYEKKLAHR
jgi:hypothetical protein